jgi:hypothetical protein
MKIEKYIGGNGRWFSYKDSETGRNHGLFNDLETTFPFGIGYNYKHENKGFWLQKHWL